MTQDRQDSSQPLQLHGNVSKLFRATSPGQWNHIDLEPYKRDTQDYRGVTRQELVGKRGETTRFHVRYFEIEQHGYSTLERHEHEHVVYVVKGAGSVTLGCRVRDLNVGDIVYVGPNDPHQFRNAHEQPFGFLCIVNADRDRPRTVEGDRFCVICE